MGAKLGIKGEWGGVLFSPIWFNFTLFNKGVLGANFF